MTQVKRLALFLWDIDPGYFRLKLAAKTVLAILIALGLVNDEPLVTKAMASLVCGMSMQGVNAKPFWSRVKQVILFDFAYFAAFGLGLFIRDHAEIKAIVLIILGFAVNYLRRFDLQHSMAPMMIWLLCFLATILPFSATSQAWTHLHEIVVGLVISALVLLFIFPENYPRLFVSNSNRIFKHLAVEMNNLRRHVLTADASMNFECLPFVYVKESLNHLLTSNQAMEQSDLFNEQQALITEILIHEYALVYAYSVLVEAYRMLRIHDYQLPQEIRIHLILINKQFATLFESLIMRTDYSVEAIKNAVSLSKLAEKINHETITNPMVVMILLNLKLSFNLFNQHVTALLRGDNAT